MDKYMKYNVMKFVINNMSHGNLSFVHVASAPHHDEKIYVTKR